MARKAVFLVAALALSCSPSSGNGNGPGDAGGGGGGGGGGGSGGGGGPTYTLQFPTLSIFAGQVGGAGTVDGLTTNGFVDLDAGSDISPAAARLNGPSGIAYDPAGNVIYISDTANQNIRVVANDQSVTTLAGSAVTRQPTNGLTLSGGSGAVTGGSADGVGTAAQFNDPLGIALDGAGHLFVADSTNDTIRQVDVATGAVTTVAGAAGQTGSQDGVGAAARFQSLGGLASDGAGHLYLTDGSTIRELTAATGQVTTVAGVAGQTGNADGVGSAALFAQPEGLAFDGLGHLYISDLGEGSGNPPGSLRALATATGAVTTIATTPSPIEAASWLAWDQEGHLVFPSGQTIDEVDLATGAITVISGLSETTGTANGIGPQVRFDDPAGVAFEGWVHGNPGQRDAGAFFVADNNNNTIRVLGVAEGIIGPGPNPTNTLVGLAPHPGHADGSATSASFYAPEGMAWDGAGRVFVADRTNCLIRAVDIASGSVTTLAGQAEVEGSNDGTGAAAQFANPTGVAWDGAGHVYVADFTSNEIRKLDVATNAVTTVAGSTGPPGHADGTGAAALLEQPGGIAFDGAGHFYFSEFGNDDVRELDGATGAVTTIAGSPGNAGTSDGTGSAAGFTTPMGVAWDGAGHLFVADMGNHTIRKVTVATGAVTTIAGAAGQPGSADGTGAAARFDDPMDLAWDGAGHLFVADAVNATVRRIDVATGAVTTVAGAPNSVGVQAGPTPASLNAPNGLVFVPSKGLFVSDQVENSILLLH